MRILFLVYRDVRNPAAVGGDLYLWELAKGLAKKGNKVTLICSKYIGSKTTETTNGVNVVRLSGKWTLPFRLYKTYLTKAKDNFDVVLEEAIGGERFPFFSLFYVKEPLISVWHQKNSAIFRNQYPFLLYLFLSLLERFMARLYLSKIIITPSQKAKLNLLTLGFKENNIKVVYDGVSENLEKFEPQSHRENIIVCLGKIRKYKRIDHAVRAFQKVVKIYEIPAKLIIAGKISELDRGYLNYIRKLAINLGISQHVEFRINISEEEKMHLLGHARLLVQPSPVEGFSIVVAEANSCGTPVVVSDGVPDDVVIDNFNGVVYPFGNIDLMAKKIAYLFNDENTWNKLSQNSLKWVKRFTWHNSVTELEEILKKMQ